MGHAGVPSADQVVEDIFSGGDGWCGQQPYDAPTTTSGSIRRQAGAMGVSTDDNGHWSDDGSSGTIRANKRSWPDFQFSKRGRGSRESLVGMRSRGSFGQVSQSEMDKDYGGLMPELDELEVRDDLKCWNSREF
jgi:hypothetical protein